MARRTTRSVKRVVTIGTAGLASAAMVAAFTPTAHASSGGDVPVPGGFNVNAIPGSEVFGTTDPSAPVTVSFVLKMRGMPSLENSVERGTTGTLSVAQFAARYGQSTAKIAELTDYLKSFGITSTVLADNIDITATGTAGQFDNALSIVEHNVRVPAQTGSNGHQDKPAQIVHAPKTNPMLPRNLASMVTAILGLSNYAPYSSQAVHVNPHLAAAASTSTGNCPVPARSSACHLPADYASRYGLDKLYATNANGAGRTIGIVTLAALDQGAPEYFWKNYLGLPDTGRTVTVQNIDGGPGAPSDQAGTGETDLDVEQSGGVAPGANVVVYQAPNSDGGWADAFFTAASQNVADSVSSSWGESETIIRAAVASGQETPALQTAYDEAFLELAAQGQSTFLASGDEGAYIASADLGTTDLSVDGPADSPFVTSTGGTTTPWAGTFHGNGTTAAVNVPVERAWGWDYLWQPISTVTGTRLDQVAETTVAGGGGGYSTVEPRPAYQQGVAGMSNWSAVQYLTPTDYQQAWGLTLPTAWSLNPNPSVTAGVTTSGRVEPDLSADADPYSGYLLYEPSAPGNNQLQAGWGGTSFVAPQFNGSTAVMDQALGRRVGFWNPVLYRLAMSGQSPVSPIETSGTSSDNLFYTGTPGNLFNPAVGLGTPDFAKFTADLSGN